jgi:hypothetical protein
MSDDTERSVASAGSQPVAWSVDWDGEIDCDFVYRDRESAMDVIADNDETSGVVVPLYRQPQPTLTDEERTFLRMVRDTYAMQDDDEVCGMIAASISGLLERTK